MLTTDEKLAKAMDLLGRAVATEMMAPDPTWFREFFLLSGDHMILTDEGWESGDVKQEYLRRRCPASR